MKKALFLLLAVLFAFSAAGVACAAGTTRHELRECNLALSLPSDWSFLTRDNQEGDPLLGTDLSPEEIQKILVLSGIHLIAASEDYSRDLLVFTDEEYSDDLSDLRMYKEEHLADVANFLAREYDLQASTYEIIDAAQATYIILRPNMSDDDEFGQIDLFTARDGLVYRMTLFTYDGPVTAVDESLLKMIAFSLEFPATTSNGQLLTAFSTAATSFSNDDAGVSFTVPAGWVMQGGDGASSITYGNSRGDTLHILITDLWATLPDEQKQLLERSDIHNGIFTKEDIAGMLSGSNLHSSDVEYTTLNGVEYFKVQVIAGSGRDDPSAMNMTLHMFHSNGYRYEFNFWSLGDSPAYQEYEALMSSVQYTHTPPAGAMPSAAAPDISGDAFEFPGIIGIVVGIFLMGIVYTLPILIYRFGVRKRPVPVPRAKLIAAVYSLGIFVLTLWPAFLLGLAGSAGPAVGWGFLNYLVLKSGRAEDDPETPDPGVPVVAVGGDGGTHRPAPQRSGPPCRACGSALFPGSAFCDKCGGIQS